MSRTRYALYSLPTALLLVGCGQSGPLYMPGNPSQISAPAIESGEPAADSQEADDSDNE